jgi:release factor glutamine methyltransferase
VRLRAAGCVFAEDEAALLIEAATDADSLERLVARRVAGEPLEYVLGWAAFAGLRVHVAAGVFVPRRRTELLLRLALGAARDPAPPAMLELCCGVAPVATALKTRLPQASVTASDLDPDAVRIARANLEPLGGTVLAGDLFGGLPTGERYGVIVANAPYVPSAELRNMPREAREFEHPLALDGGEDGLALHRRIAAEAATWLAPGGTLLVETSRRQASADRTLFTAHGWRVELAHDDELDATAVRAVRA